MRMSPRLLADDRIGLLDYLLAGLAGITATYSMAMSLLRPQMGWFFVIFIGLGTMASYSTTRIFAGRKWLEVGGFLYFLFALLAVFYSRQLNAVLPEDGFEGRELTIAAVLSWMILLGSWVSWRDSTLLFQAVPSIALFGLVGAFSTFEGATVAFFIFLLCLATLFARAHARSMLKQALDSGYTRLDTIRQGPWRWMAGPEWALASAAIVVLISVFGAPILQESVKGVSGIVRIPIPRLPRSAAQPPSLPPGSANTSSSSVAVGTGPLSLPGRLIFKANLDQPRHLRVTSYSSYSRGRWFKQALDQNSWRQLYDASMAERRRILNSGTHEKVPFQIFFEGMALDSLPAPGEVTSMKRPDLFTLAMDGGLVINSSIPLNSSFEGTTAVLKPGVAPTRAPMPVPEFLFRYTSSAEIPSRVAALSDRVTAGLETDYEKALAIKAEIERRCLYNLDADAAPPGMDPVDNFLFGSKEGYCDLFASAMVLMARQQMIPARYVRGYIPIKPKGEEDGLYPILDSSAHAWAELYFENVGWVVFDTTEGAEAVPGNGVGAENDTTPWFKRPWFAMLLNIAIGMSVVGAGAFAIRGVWTARAAVDWSQIEMARNYEAFAAALQRASGQPRRPSQTASEYLALTVPSLGSAKEVAQKVNDLFVAALYAPPGVERPSPSDLREPVRQFKKVLREARRGRSAP